MKVNKIIDMPIPNINTFEIDTNKKYEDWFMEIKTIWNTRVWLIYNKWKIKVFI